jgi:hypothetical protein
VSSAVYWPVLLATVSLVVNRKKSVFKVFARHEAALKTSSPPWPIDVLSRYLRQRFAPVVSTSCESTSSSSARRKVRFGNLRPYAPPDITFRRLRKALKVFENERTRPVRLNARERRERV